jgi:ABC-type sugar transport system ATPase subunit
MNVSGSPFLEIKNISKTYSGVTVLKNVNFRINSGEVLALVGENGAGKSTLIKVLSGVIKPDDGGEILINGNHVEFHSPRDAEEKNIVTVYQELNLFPDLSITENLFYHQFHKIKGRIKWKELHKEAKRFLDEFGVDLAVENLVSTLSVAEKQMLEIAKSLYTNPRLIILDEPTAVLGGEDVDRLLEVVKGLQKRGVAVIFISHRLNEIFGLANRYLVLKDGDQVGEGNIVETNPDELVGKMVGRHVSTSPQKRINFEQEEVVMKVEGLTRKGVFHDINFSLFKGEVLGIAGLRGAGRTEIVRAIFGADPIDSGKVIVKGRQVKINSPKKAIKNGIGLVPEERKSQGLFMNFSSQTNMFTATTKKWIRQKEEKKIAQKYVESLKIKLPNLGTLVGRLSGGNQQKVVLAKWLESGIDILIMDEPTRGVDVGAKAQIYEVIRELCNQGMSVIVISSELPEILENCNRILVVHKGEIAGELDNESASEEVIMKYAVGGMTK